MKLAEQITYITPRQFTELIDERRGLLSHNAHVAEKHGVDYVGSAYFTNYVIYRGETK